eukprot:CAMPEP_0172486392 /NCGR_PEP_ID=MMETSP1066-20121228/14958_1 /TAXON_ID=671091 /ORGANISM="Coscinodiscus wailesii, Strain CCMP2513" /LENGTH=160 /DNA_ID=CAMNT_0013252319 /DNA_START=145 /DNA_END=627 /DNA_ORIENTATION=+
MNIETLHYDVASQALDEDRVFISDNCAKDSEEVANNPSLQAAIVDDEKCIGNSCDQNGNCDISNCTKRFESACKNAGGKIIGLMATVSCSGYEGVVTYENYPLCVATSCTGSDIEEIKREKVTVEQSGCTFTVSHAVVTVPIRMITFGMVAVFSLAVLMV